MIAKLGYPVETHTVTTEDCYILTMHRIPYGKKSPPVEVNLVKNPYLVVPAVPILLRIWPD